MAEDEEPQSHSEFVKKYLWLVRPCHDYEAEARECKLLRSRFHQYYTKGTFTDCNTLIKDAQNCPKCVSDHSDKHCMDIIKNERERRLVRYEGHIKNDVWEKREKPPDNWNNELPSWWLQENKNSVFKDLNEEFQQYIACNEPKRPFTLCVIL